MLTLNFKNLRDEVPEVGKYISYYIAKNPLICSNGGFDVTGGMAKGITSFDWCGVKSMGANSCCYDQGDPVYKDVPIGYETKFLEDGNLDVEDEYEIFRKVLYLENSDQSSTIQILPFNSPEPKLDEDIEIFWEYTYQVELAMYKQTDTASNNFPCRFVEEHLESGDMFLVSPAKLTDITCNHSGYEYKHVTLEIDFLGNLWKIDACQTGEWSEDAWIDGKYAEIDIFRVSLISEVGDYV